MVVTRQLVMAILFGISAQVHADKEIYYANKSITIYTDNTVVYTGKNESPVFKPSETWVEEDCFIQQEKYYEVDSNYIDKLKKSLNIQT